MGRVPRPQPALWSDVRGVAQTEYAIVLVLVVVLMSVAIALLSKPLVAYHDTVTRPASSPLL